MKWFSLSMFQHVYYRSCLTPDSPASLFLKVTCYSFGVQLLKYWSIYVHPNMSTSRIVVLLFCWHWYYRSKMVPRAPSPSCSMPSLEQLAKVTSFQCFLLVKLGQKSANLVCKWSDHKYFRLCGFWVSVTTNGLCHCIEKAAIDDTQRNERDCASVPI